VHSRPAGDAGAAGGGYIRGCFDYLERLVSAVLAPATRAECA